MGMGQLLVHLVIKVEWRYEERSPSVKVDCDFDVGVFRNEVTHSCCFWFREGRWSAVILSTRYASGPNIIMRELISIIAI